MSPVALAWQQFRFERKLFWRNPSAAFFNFLLPLLLLVLTASAFSADDEELNVLIPGISISSSSESAENAVAVRNSSSRGSRKLKKAALGLRQNSLRSKRNCCQASAIGLTRTPPA